RISAMTSIDNTPVSPAQIPDGYTPRGGNYWTLFTPEIWKVLHAVLQVASETPNQDGVYVRITGRKGGLISFVLAFVGIDPTVSLLVDRENVRFKEGTWHGFNSCVTPIENLCSGNYGYAKPFWGTVVLLVVALFMLLSDETALRIASLILILGAILYYFLNKTTKLGVTYVDGGWNGFAFKRSIIEGKNIDEISAERIISIIEMIMLGKDKLNAINVDGSARASGGIDGGEQARQKMDALKAQALRAGERAASKVAASLATVSENMSRSVGEPGPKCPGCGEAIKAEDTFCGNCGRAVR
ncbi:MAG: zinc ribbon domain-containing protein, partial [Sulfurimicrobium sp.]|nr:zinc ribbon domain-containing protein [Sulfurimicrobium sp.]